MSFATRTWVAGELVSAAIANAQWRDNLAYLHGDAGPISLNDSVVLANLKGLQVKDSTSIVRSLLTLDSSDRPVLGDSGLDALTKALIVNHKYLRVGGASGRAVQTRGDGATGHMEGGTVSISGVGGFGSIAVTFTTTFAATPYVAAASGNDGVICWLSGKSTTGFTLNVRDVVNSGTTKTVSADWVATGTN